LEVGKHTIVFDFKSDGPGLGKGGTGVLSVDGKEVARNSMDHTTPITFPEDETFDVGEDTRTPVAELEHHYDVPFKFTGKILHDQANCAQSVQFRRPVHASLA
jgi:hypothetical protein